MNYKISLYEIFLKKFFDCDLEKNMVIKFLQKDLESLIKLLIIIYTSDILNTKDVPNGFTNRFEKTFENSVLGKLKELLLFISNNYKSSNISKEFNLLIKNLYKNENSWINKLVRCRNQYNHPKEKSVNDIIKETCNYLKNNSQWMKQINFEYNSKKTLFYSASILIPLTPFAYFNKRLIIFSSFGKDYEIKFSNSDIETTKSSENFKDKWVDIRIMDKGLSKPTTKELINKIKSKRYEINKEQIAPKWSKDILKFKEVSALISEDIIYGLINEIKNLKNLLFIKVKLIKNKRIDTIISEEIGLSEPFSIELLTKLLKEGITLIIVIDSKDTKGKDFLNLLYWLSDINSKIKNNNALKVFIIREKLSLEEEQETLWDKLPDDIDELFIKPYKSRGEELSDLIWTKHTKKGFLNIF